MAHSFQPVDRDQQFLLPPDMGSWLAPSHPVWAVIDAVGALDLTTFEARYQLGGVGRAAYDPAMMVTLLVWCYTNGIESSRRIELACQENVACRVICGNQPPDHTAIARFRQRHLEDFKTLFIEVLALCGRAGLVRVGVVAVDGTKMSANAGLGANRSEEWLRAEIDEIVARAAAADSAEDESHGDRGDGLSEEMTDPVKRRAALDAAAAELKAHSLQRVNTTDPQSRPMMDHGRYVQGYNAQAIANEHQVVLAGEVVNDFNDLHQLWHMVDEMNTNLDTIGVSDRADVVLGDAGYCDTKSLTNPPPGAPRAIVATGKAIKTPAEIGPDPLEDYTEELARLETFDDEERARRVAMCEQVAAGTITRAEAAEALGISYPQFCTTYAAWHNGGTAAVSIPKRRRPTRPPAPALLRHRLDTELTDAATRALFNKRAGIIEPVFANTKHNKAARAFRCRGLTAARGEWNLILSVHNLEKAINAMTRLFALAAA